MSYASAPFWWILCDEPPCARKSTEDGENAAWDDQSGAREEAINSEWVESDSGLFFCPEHRDRVCGECEKYVPGGVKPDQDSMCDKCWAEDAERNHGKVEK